MTDTFTPLADLQAQAVELEKQERDLTIAHGSKSPDREVRRQLSDLAQDRKRLRILIEEAQRIANSPELAAARAADSKKRAQHRAQVRTVARGMRGQFAQLQDHLNKATELAHEIATTGRHQSEHLHASATVEWITSDHGLDRSMVVLPSAVGASSGIGKELASWFTAFVAAGGWQTAIQDFIDFREFALGSQRNPNGITAAADRDVKVVEAHTVALESQEA